jgi:hypothetical protein
LSANLADLGQGLGQIRHAKPSNALPHKVYRTNTGCLAYARGIRLAEHL